MLKGRKDGKSGKSEGLVSDKEKIEKAFKQSKGKLRGLEDISFTKELLAYLLQQGKENLEEGKKSLTRRNRPSSTMILQLYISRSEGNEDTVNNEALILALEYFCFDQSYFKKIIMPLLARKFDITYIDFDGKMLGEKLLNLVNMVNSAEFRREIFEAVISNLKDFVDVEAPISKYLRNMVIRFFESAVDNKVIDMCKKLMPFGLGVVLPLVAVAEHFAKMKRETAEEDDASSHIEKKEQLDACVQWLEDHEKISSFEANVFHSVLCNKKFDMSLTSLQSYDVLRRAFHFAGILGAKDMVEDFLKILAVSNGVNEECFLTKDEEEQKILAKNHGKTMDNNVGMFMCSSTVFMRVIFFKEHTGIVKILWPDVVKKLDAQARNKLLALAIEFSSPEIIQFLLEQGVRCKAVFSLAINSESSLSKLTLLNKSVPSQLNEKNDQGMNVLDVIMNEILTPMMDGFGLQVRIDKFGGSAIEKIKLLLSYNAVCNKDLYGILLELVVSDVRLHGCVIYVLNMILGDTTCDLPLLKKYLTKNKATIQLLKIDAKKSLVLLAVIHPLRYEIQKGTLRVVRNLESVHLLCTNAINLADMNGKELKLKEVKHMEEKKEMEQDIVGLKHTLLETQRALDRLESKNKRLEEKRHKQSVAASPEVSSLQAALAASQERLAYQTYTGRSIRNKVGGALFLTGDHNTVNVLRKVLDLEARDRSGSGVPDSDEDFESASSRCSGANGSSYDTATSAANSPSGCSDESFKP